MRIRGVTSGTLEWLTDIFTLTTTNTYTVEDDLPLQLETEIDLFELFESNGLCSVTGFRFSREIDFAEIQVFGKLVLTDTYTLREDDEVWIQAHIGNYWTQEVLVATVTVLEAIEPIAVDIAPMFETELTLY